MPVRIGKIVASAALLVSSLSVAAVAVPAVGTNGPGETPTQLASASKPVVAPRFDGLHLPTPFLNADAHHTHAVALDFVRKTGLNKNLSLILLEGLKTDNLVTSAIKRQGFAKVQGVVVRAIQFEYDRYAIAWDQLLASTYSQFFSANELASLTELQDTSPYFVRLVELQEQISAAIALNGSDILSQAQRTVRERLAVDLGA